MNTKKIFYAIRYALVCACLPAATTSIAADITASFADANFLAAVRIALVKGLNDPVADTEAASLASLNVSGKNIANLAGIEHFSSLTYLNCSANRLEELPAALPAGLKTLHCAGNRLNALPASLPGGLEYLNCSSNQLVSLPALPASLQMLGCSGNRLEALPDALPGGLEYLNCSSNQIAELPALPASLTSLSGHENRLPALPTLPPKLQYMDVHNNRIAALPSLPASLQWFVCSGNQIEALPALPASLRYLDGSGNRLTALPTLPGGLADLYCHNNNLASLPALPEGLTGLDCFSNRLTALPALPASLKWLNGYDNRLAMLPALPDGLEYLSCHNNQLTALPSLPKALKELDCFDNQLAALPELPAGLQQLYCAGNRLAALPGLPETLQLLSCADNRLTGIALNGYANYTYIDVRYNYLPDQSHVTGAPISWNTGSFYFSPQLPPGFKAVAAIEGVPATAIAHVPLTLSAKVSPTDATNRTIVWSITDAGTTGAKLSGNVFTATATGRATLLASIANGESPDGRPYQQSFAIAVATGPVKEVELQLLSETTLRIHNTGNVETGTLRLTLTGTRSEAFALAPSNPGSLPAGGETIVTISAVADLPPLSYALRLTVEADNMKPVAIDIALRIVPDSAESVEPQALRVAAAEGGLHISGLIPGKRFLVYNLRGELISNETARAAGQMLPLPMRGLYILVHEGQSLKAVY